MVPCASVLLVLAAGACSAPDAEDEPVESTHQSLGVTLAGRIQAEAFDTGGEGVGYHDTTAGNAGGAYRTGEGVDIETCTDSGGGFDVGWTAAGEWLAYSVQANVSGTYRFSLRVASAYAGTKSLHIEVDGVALPVVSFTDASGWQSWRTLAAGSRSLSAGAHKLKIVSDTGHANVNYLEVQAPVSALRLGVSATSPDATNQPYGTSTYSAEVNRQVSVLGAKAFFDYFQAGENPHWSGEGTSYPSTADVVASTKVADSAAVRAYVDSIPAREGKVYLHYWQEPEDDVEKKGTFTLQQFIDRTMAVHAAIPAGNTTVVPTVHLQEYWLRTRGEAFEAAYIPSTTKHVSWSLYSAGGDTDPVASVQRIDTFMRNRFPTLTWGIGAVGYPLPASHTAAQAQARASWLSANVAAVRATPSLHYMWFDTNWSSGDYRIANDPVLLQQWTNL